ncbi:TetR/AcrR family transcriptional regulator [Saccharopolyspora sp. HNM0983]|uniref:TetR/AcrR family transcriptional regulator n=2 Tax=Saccharopolyspora montiporae TaxID=2781240 RepID=A0A929BF59_9PSEU|nr:TetR/AcrR family transcriptional regulator [Saccharopolyspora sp. HNM0983]
MKLIYANGFHGMTVDALLAASGVPKGSFYHHFGSKEAFAQAVLGRYMQFQIDLLDRWIAQEELSTADRITGYFHDMAQAFVGSDYQRACLAGKLSTEVAATSELFRDQLDHDLRQWKNRLVNLLEHGRQRGDVRTDRDPGDLADGLLALIQGAFVIALSTRDERSLKAVMDTIHESIAPR